MRTMRTIDDLPNRGGNTQTQPKCAEKFKIADGLPPRWHRSTDKNPPGLTRGIQHIKFGIYMLEKESPQKYNYYNQPNPIDNGSHNTLLILK